MLSLASMIELEAKNAEDRAEVSGVFYNRLNKNMSLGSDVTTYYAYKVDMGERDLYMSEINGYNPYNTRGPRMEGKLPIGPISSISKDALDAAFIAAFIPSTVISFPSGFGFWYNHLLGILFQDFLNSFFKNNTSLETFLNTNKFSSRNFAIKHAFRRRVCR